MFACWPSFCPSSCFEKNSENHGERVTLYSIKVIQMHSREVPDQDKTML